MRKANEPICCASVDLTYTPKFHCGDDVLIKFNARTPQGKFFSGFCGTVGGIDCWWPKEYSYRVVLHHSDDNTCVIPSEVWIKESDLELDESYMMDDLDEPFCVYVPHGVTTSLTPEEIRDTYKFQRDDGDGVYYCTISKEDYEAWLFDDEEPEDVMVPEEPKRGRWRPRKHS